MKGDNFIQEIEKPKEDKFSKLYEEHEALKKKEETTKKTLIECQKKWTKFSLEIIGIVMGVYLLELASS